MAPGWLDKQDPAAGADQGSGTDRHPRSEAVAPSNVVAPAQLPFDVSYLSLGGNAAVTRLVAGSPGSESGSRTVPGAITPAEIARVVGKLRSYERLERRPGLAQKSGELATVTFMAENAASDYRDVVARFDTLLESSGLGVDLLHLGAVLAEERSRTRALDAEAALESVLRPRTLAQIRAGQADPYQSEQLAALATWLSELTLATLDVSAAAEAVSGLSGGRASSGTVVTGATSLLAYVNSIRTLTVPLNEQAEALADPAEIIVNALLLIPMDVLTFWMMGSAEGADEFARLKQHFRPFPYRSSRQAWAGQALEAVFAGLVEGVVLDTLVAIEAVGGVRAVAMSAELASAEVASPLTRLRALFSKPGQFEAALTDIEDLGRQLRSAAKALPADEASEVLAQAARADELLSRLRAELRQEASFAELSAELGLDAPGGPLQVPAEWVEVHEQLTSAIGEMTGSRRQAVAQVQIDTLPQPFRVADKAKAKPIAPASDLTLPERHILREEPFQYPEGFTGPGLPRRTTQEGGIEGLAGDAKEKWLQQHRVPGEHAEHPGSRAHDAEVKVLERVADKLPKDPAARRLIHGTIHLAPTHAPCPACLATIHAFRGDFPGIQVVLH